MFKAHILSWQAAPVKSGHKLRRACACGGKSKASQVTQQTCDAARINPLFPQAAQGKAVVALCQALSLHPEAGAHGLGGRTIAQEFEKSNQARGQASMS